MILVFNELSAHNVAPSRHQARERTTNLIRAVAALASGQSTTLVSIDDTIYQTPLAEGYTVSQWSYDERVDHDLRNFFLKISTKISFEQDVSEAVKEQFSLSEFHFQQQEAGGLGLAWLLKTTAASLPSEEYWLRTHIPVHRKWLESTGTEREKDVRVLNLSEMTHVPVVFDELTGKAQGVLRDEPVKLAERKADCFPHLTFGLDVNTQIAALSVEILRMAIAKLIVLDTAVRNWRREGTDEPVLPKVNPESEATMQQYGREREFQCASGEKKVFNLHAMIGSGHRIHLRIDKQIKSLEIGYIGEHLPTARFH
ncbi:MAG: hypothetical protein OXB94_10740 [Nitrospira sp.]|nr:hypothetical protein [Nitrospira sp.]